MTRSLKDQTVVVIGRGSGLARAMVALALFATAVLVALIQPVAGLGFIGFALLLHLRPDVARRSPLRPWRRGQAAG